MTEQTELDYFGERIGEMNCDLRVKDQQILRCSDCFFFIEERKPSISCLEILTKCLKLPREV